MSYTYTVDMFCDFCCNWKPGTSSGIPVSLREVWKKMKREGWEIVWENGKQKHKCPVCLGKIRDFEYYVSDR